LLEKHDGLARPLRLICLPPARRDAVKQFRVFALVTTSVAMLCLGLPANAYAQHRGGGRSARVVVVNRPHLYSYNPFLYDPFLFDPFYSPWSGYQWGGYPYPYRYRVAPADASVRVEVEPRTSNVYVDGYYAGTVDEFDGVFQRLHVTPGQHEIVVQHDGYRSHRERLYLGPNATRKISHHLEKLAAGEPNEPPPTPIAEPREAHGESTAKPDRPGTFTRRVPAPMGRPRMSSAGTLSVRVQPDDAEIFIDGERWAGGSDDVQLIVQLSEGPHRVEVQRDGYHRIALDVHVRRHETTPVNVSLSKE
jgi:hypothetical protein